MEGLEDSQGVEAAYILFFCSSTKIFVLQWSIYSKTGLLYIYIYVNIKNIKVGVQLSLGLFFFLFRIIIYLYLDIFTECILTNFGMMQQLVPIAQRVFNLICWFELQQAWGRTDILHVLTYRTQLYGKKVILQFGQVLAGILPCCEKEHLSTFNSSESLFFFSILEWNNKN